MNDRSKEESVALQKGSLKVTRSNTVPYAFTLRKVGKRPVDIYGVYAAKLGEFEDLGLSVTNNVFEHKGGVHVHGVMQVPKGFKLRRIRVRGWRIQLDEIYDMAGWQAYLAKEQILREPDDTPPDPDFKMPKVKLFV